MKRILSPGRILAQLKPYKTKAPHLRYLLLVLILTATTFPLCFLDNTRTAYADEIRTLTDLWGITRTELVAWLELHEHDNYYLETPYRPFDWRSPNGDINGWGSSSDGSSPGMNCTGFVWHALCAAHAWNDDIASRLPALQGWTRLIRNENLLCYYYDSKEAMLSGGKLEKGDIIWMFDQNAGGMNALSNFHHVGIFWGNSPSDDKLWHSVADDINTWSGYNRISNIYAKATSVLYVVVKIEPEKGYLNLAKASSLPSITNGNANYSLEGAEYDIFGAEGNWISTLVTNHDGQAQSEALSAGWYKLKEKTPSKGYALDSAEYWAEVLPGQTVNVNEAAGGVVQEQPFSTPISLWVKKLDFETNKNIQQGEASLAGAEFKVNYYDGYYPTDDKAWIDEVIPTRSWIIKTNEQGEASLENDCLISGDPFYHDLSGTATIPLGTITVQEIKAPTGYLVDDQSIHIQQITYNSKLRSTTSYHTPSSKDQIIRGGVALQKLDLETMLSFPLGGASFEGAAFDIVSKNQNPVVVEGVTYTEGQVVKTLTLVEGVTTTEKDTLPYGSYEIREVLPPTGYLLSEKAQSFSIRENAVIVELTGENTIADQVIRGDLEFVKIEEKTMKRMAFVPFEIKSNTTGETHVIITDKNGYCNTSSQWNLHSHNTNQGKSDKDGVWFALAHDGSTATVDDTRGALPFDTYTINELPCKANEGKERITFEISIMRDMTIVNLGTISNEVEPKIVPPQDNETPKPPAPTNKVPKTGDDLGVIAYALLGIVVVAGVSLALIVKKKNRKDYLQMFQD